VRSRSRLRVLVSAHRFGAGSDTARQGTLPALAAALDLGVDHVEIDVQRCLDATLVVHHDDHVELAGQRLRIDQLTVGQLEAVTGSVVLLADVLDAIGDRARAHLDLKLDSPDDRYAEAASTHEVAAVALAVERLGAERVLVTTLDDRAARAVRDWADAQGHDLLVGLSLGRSVRGLPWTEQVRVRVSELRPRRRFGASRADVVVAQHTLARLGVAAFARRTGRPLLVWTVDTEDSLRHWLRPGRAWLVTTNEPALALRVREEWDRERAGRRRRAG